MYVVCYSIFITHLHGDHCFGLSAALRVIDDTKAAAWNSASIAAVAAGSPPPSRPQTHVYGPPGVAELLRVALVLTGASRQMSMQLLVTELVDSEEDAHAPQVCVWWPGGGAQGW